MIYTVIPATYLQEIVCFISILNDFRDTILQKIFYTAKSIHRKIVILVTFEAKSLQVGQPSP